MHQDTTWYGCRPQPKQHCVRWGPSSRSPKGVPPIFGPCPLCQTAGRTKTPLGMEVGLGQGDFVLDRDLAPPEKRAQPPRSFRAMFLVAKRLDG